MLDRSQDSLGRSTGYQLKNGGATESAAIYNYSPTTGRLDSVGNGTDTFTYAYTANSSLLASVTKSGSPVIQTTHTWEPTRNVLDVKENKVGSTVVSSHDYSVNSLGQRTAVDTAGSAFAAGERDRTWSYDALGQVTAESDANNAAFHRGFAYDAIGNRTASIEGDIDTTQAGATNYTPTALNQYDAIGVFSPTYDDDGNQLESQIRPLGSSSLESCVFVWDSENRLIEIKDAAGTTTLASYTYDSQSRRIARTVGTTSIITLYDAWNPIAEYTGTLATGFSLQASYLWGLDLSGSMQGAGGVGGLLSVTSGAGSFYPTYDGNGNVSEYLDGSGVVVAHYEYDAFGNVIFSSGASATSFQHRFSTKPQDAESGLYYYGYRYLDPVTGRWPSRDPIGERGGVNLYGFVGNDGVNGWDYLGWLEVGDRINVRCSLFKKAGEIHIKKYEVGQGTVTLLSGPNKGRSFIGFQATLEADFVEASPKCCCLNGKYQWVQTITKDNDPTQVDKEGNPLPVPRHDVTTEGNHFEDDPSVDVNALVLLARANPKKKEQEIIVHFKLEFQCVEDGKAKTLKTIKWGFWVKQDKNSNFTEGLR